MKTRVLITGAHGLVGEVLRRRLGEGYELGEIDVKTVKRLGFRTKDMTKLATVESAFVGNDIVVDLAADASPAATWDVIYGNNLLATFNAFEASRRAGVRRVVFASSNHVTGLYEHDHPYAAIVAGRYKGLDPTAIPLLSTKFAIRPDGLYAVGKAFGEALARMYAETYGLSVICLRIGTVNASDRPRNPRHFATLLTHADLDRLVRSAIEAPPELRFGIFYGVSNNTWRFWDIADASEELAYQPQDDAETWR